MIPVILSDITVQSSHKLLYSRTLCSAISTVLLFTALMWWGAFEVAKGPVYFHWLWRRGGSLLPPDRD